MKNICIFKEQYDKVYNDTLNNPTLDAKATAEEWVCKKCAKRYNNTCPNKCWDEPAFKNEFVNTDISNTMPVIAKEWKASSCGRSIGKMEAIKKLYKDKLYDTISLNFKHILLVTSYIGVSTDEIVEVATKAIYKVLNVDLNNPLSIETCYGCVDRGKCGIRTMHGCPSKKILPFGTEVSDWFAGHKIIEEQAKIDDFKREVEGAWMSPVWAYAQCNKEYAGDWLSHKLDADAAKKEFYNKPCVASCEHCNAKNDCPDRDTQVFKKEDIDKCKVIKTYDKSKDNCKDCTISGCGIFTDDGCNWKEVPQDITYTDIYKQFIDSNPVLNDAVNDWRPEGSMSIIVWLKNNFNHTLVVSMDANNNLSYEWRYKDE